PDIERVFAQEFLPTAQRRPRLNDPLHHAHVVEHTDIIGRPYEDSTANLVAGPQKLAIDGAVWVADGHGLPFAPTAETGTLQTAGIQNVHQETARVTNRLPSHVGTGDAAVIDRRRLNGVDSRLAAEQIGALGHVAGGVNEWHVGLHEVVDKNALIGPDTSAGRQLHIRSNTGRDDHEVDV